MPPELLPFRSASPEGMEEVHSAEGAKLNGKDRKNPLAFKEPAEKPEEPEKERQMIGRADQVYEFQACLVIESTDGTPTNPDGTSA